MISIIQPLQFFYNFHAILDLMPIIVPEGCCDDRLSRNLENASIPTVGAEEVSQLDVVPTRIGLLNLMPAASMEATEMQWLRWIGSGPLQIEPVLVKFDNDQRESAGSSRAELLCDYTPFSEVAETGLDGLIVTGDNLEVEAFSGIASRKPIGLDQINYAKALNSIIDWARGNVPSTIYSCLGGHYALNYLHGLPREINPHKPKTFGVYEHDIVAPESPFVRDIKSPILSPHTRWGNISPERISTIKALTMLAINEQVGWLLVTDPNDTGGEDLFIQGHPEYYAHDLETEYLRDLSIGQAAPQNYYEDDDPDKPIKNTWESDARALHGNWIKYLFERS